MNDRESSQTRLKVNPENTQKTGKGNQNKTFNKRIIWIPAAIICIIGAFCFPSEIIKSHPIIFASSYATICNFFIIQSIADFRSFREINLYGKKHFDWRHKLCPLYVTIGIGVSICMLIYYSTNDKNNFIKFNEFGKGEILYTEASKNENIHKIKVKFTTKQGETYISTCFVKNDLLKSLNKNKRIGLMYSSIDPSVIKILP